MWKMKTWMNNKVLPFCKLIYKWNIERSTNFNKLCSSLVSKFYFQSSISIMLLQHDYHFVVTWLLLKALISVVCFLWWCFMAPSYIFSIEKWVLNNKIKCQWEFFILLEFKCLSCKRHSIVCFNQCLIMLENENDLKSW